MCKDKSGDDEFPPEDGVKGFIYYFLITLFFGSMLIGMIFLMTWLCLGATHLLPLSWAGISAFVIASLLMAGSGYGGTTITASHTLIQAINGGVGLSLVWLGVYFYLLGIDIYPWMCSVGGCMFLHFAASPHPWARQSEACAAHSAG